MRDGGSRPQTRPETGPETGPETRPEPEDAGVDARFAAPASVASDASDASDAAPTTRAMVVASLRVGAGGLLLARTGLSRLVGAAAAAARPPVGAVPVEPTGMAPVGTSSGFAEAALTGLAVQVASRVAATTERVAGAVVPRMASTRTLVEGTVPAVLRHRVARRVAIWAALGAQEQARDRAAAEIALDLAAGFMTDWIVERLDVNRIVERLRLDDIIANLELTDVILSSSGGVTGHVLDNARARAVSADAIVDRVMARVRPHRGRPPAGDAEAAQPVAPA